jgi:chemotaxis protein MotB
MSDYKSNSAWDDTRMVKPADAGPNPSAERQAEGYELGNVKVGDYSQPPPRPRGSAAPWIFTVLTLGAAGAFVGLVHLPLKGQVDELSADLAESRAQQEKLVSQIENLERTKGELESKQAELAQTVQQKEEALAELTHDQEELAAKLEHEIKKGDVLIKQRGGELVVDVSDQILFDSGAAELNEQGKSVLLKVGETFSKSKDKVIQVGGHTDDVPISPKLLEKFPSNWELSTARASHVVRFLQEQAKIPGQRLLATGFSQYRPASTNATKNGRRKNRRIEVVLLPAVKHL